MLPARFLLSLLLITSTISAIPGPTGDWKAQPTSPSLAFTREDGRTFDPLTCSIRGTSRPTFYLSPPIIATDSGASISGALRSVAAQGGGVVYLRNGVFLLRTPVHIPSHTCLLGAGVNRTVLRVLEGPGAVRANKVTNFTITHLTVTGAAAPGIELKLVNFATLSNVQMRGAGVVVTGAGHRWSHHVCLEDLTVRQSIDDGVAVAQTYYLSARRVRVEGSGNNGIMLSAAVIYADIGQVDIVESGRRTRMGCGLSFRPARGLIAPRRVLVTDTRIEGAYRAGACFVATKGDVYLERVTVHNQRAACYALEEGGTFNNSEPVCLGNKTYEKMVNRALPVPQANGEGCMQGLLFGEVCCPIHCAFCGGEGCGALASDGACCASEIRAMERVCGKKKPPCVVAEGGGKSGEMLVW